MLSIRWESHCVHVMGLLAEMYKNAELTDGELDTNGGLVNVHKTILAACSLYLKSEELDDPMNASSDPSDSHLNDLLEDMQSCGAVMKMEIKEQKDVGESVCRISEISNGMENGGPFGGELTARNIRDRSVSANDCNLEGTPALEVKFESVCDISETDFKEENIESIVEEDGNEVYGAEDLCTVVMKDQEDVCEEEFGYPTLSRLKQNADEPPPRVFEVGFDNSAVKKRASGSRSKKKEEETGFRPESNGAAAAASAAASSSSSEARKFTCNDCEKSFNFKSNLVKHLRTHTGEKPHSCSLCESSFTQRYNLSEHMRTHTGEKPFACSVCGVQFRQKKTLLNHVRTHTGERPFACKFCPAAFGQKNNLKVHLRIHTGEKPFSCVVCKSSFRQINVLKVHMRTHTAKAPFSCVTCAASFSHTNSLKAHERTHSRRCD